MKSVTALRRRQKLKSIAHQDLERRREYLADALEKAESVATMARSNKDGWSAILNIIRDRIVDIETTIDDHAQMTDLQRALWLERRKIAREILHQFVDISKEAADAQSRYDEVMKKLREIAV